MENVKRILLKNNYPIDLIKRLIDKKLNNLSEIRICITKVAEETTRYCSLQYVHGLSECMAKLLQRYIPNVVVAMKSIKTLNTIFTKSREKTTIFEQSGLVYKIPCMNCESVYIGQTGRHLKVRLGEHKADEKKVLKNKLAIINNDQVTGAPVEIGNVIQNVNLNRNALSPNINVISTSPSSPNRKRENKSALVQHTEKFNHNFNFLNSEVLCRQRNLRKRLFLEAWEIQSEKNACNTRTDVENLSSVYSKFL